MFTANINYVKVSLRDLQICHGRTYRCELGVPIGTHSYGDEDSSSPDIDRYGQDIAHERIIAHALENGWQESTESVEKDVLTELDHRREE
jgi:hypothetical protein